MSTFPSPRPPQEGTLVARLVPGMRAGLAAASRKKPPSPVNPAFLFAHALGKPSLRHHQTKLQLHPPRPKDHVLLDFVFDFGIVFGVSGLIQALTRGMPGSSSLPIIGSHAIASDLGIILIFAVLISSLRNMRAATRHPGHLDSVARNIRSVGAATVVLGLGLRLSVGSTTASITLACVAVASVLALCIRDWFTSVVSAPPRGRRHKRVLIVGNTSAGRNIADYLEQHPEMERLVVGLLDDSVKRGAGVIGSVDSLSRVARAQFIDEVIVALPRDPERTRTVVNAARAHHLDIQVVPDYFDCSPELVRIERFGPVPVMPLHEEPIPAGKLFCKRLLDFGLSAAGLLVLSPLLATIALAVRLDSPGPVLYTAPRAGKKGTRFLCRKFRTMCVDADQFKNSLRSHNEREGPMFKISNDPRVTRVGRWLRRYSLDELPQLWNVLVGDMSLVGPRPHPMDDYERYDLPDLRRLDAMPGLTGAWQISARRDSSFSKSMALDLDYIDNWSLWTDLRILLRTFAVVVRGTGV